MKKDRDNDFWNSLEILEDQHWISASFKGRGDFSFAGNLRFAGQWHGRIEASTEDAHLYVQKGAQISGELKATRVSVEGMLVDVDLQATVLHVLKGARILGRIRADKLIVDEGALVEGRVVSNPVAGRNLSKRPEAEI